jgi:hypothetical protein
MLLAGRSEQGGFSRAGPAGLCAGTLCPDSHAVPHRAHANPGERGLPQFGQVNMAGLAVAGAGPVSTVPSGDTTTRGRCASR